MDEKLFGKGGVKDRFDSRDFIYKDVAFALEPFDWTRGFDIEKKLGFSIPVKNQGQSFSCGGQAWSYLGQVLESLATFSFEERSAKFIYAQTFVPGGGSRGRDNCEIVTRQGWAKESVLASYEAKQPPSEVFMQKADDITPEVRNDANLAKSLSYYNVFSDMELIAHAIQNGNGCILGVTGENNGTWTSKFPVPPKANFWNHWVYAGKALVLNGKKYIGILNSWGDVGEKGWQYIGEEYIPYIWQGWALVYDAKIKHVFNTNLRWGMESPEVKFLQVRLQELGFFPQRVCTNFYGTITKEAVKKFQLSVGIIGDNGVHFGPRTREKLNGA